MFMANKQILSVVAASVLAASFTFTGCGSDDGVTSSSSSSVSSSVSSSSSSVPVEPTTLKVSDAYVVPVSATTAQIGGVDYTSYAMGTYEFPAGTTGAATVIGGVNDMNSNDVADNGEPFAPTLKAPAGYANANPFTTMLVEGIDTSAFTAAATVAANFDFDVVAESATNLAVAKETAIAALQLSVAQHTAPSSSSEASVSSEVSSAACTPLPGQASCAPSFRDGAFPDFTSSTATTSSSSSSVAPSSESPFPGLSSSSSEVSSTSSVVSSSSSSTPSTTDLTQAIADINAATTVEEINALVVTHMGAINGTYSAAVSSISSSSSSATCTPLPGQTTCESSSESSTASEVSSSSVSEAETTCLASGGTYIDGVCFPASSSSVSSTVSSSSVSSSTTSSGSAFPTF